MQDVVEARYVSGYTVWLRFDDGVAGDVDLSAYLEGEVFAPLQDRSYFAHLVVNPDTGTIEWPNRADFAPEFLYERVRVTA